MTETHRAVLGRVFITFGRVIKNFFHVRAAYVHACAFLLDICVPLSRVNKTACHKAVQCVWALKYSTVSFAQLMH